MESESKWYVKYTYVLAGLMLTVYAMILARSVLLPFLFALFFSILLSPFCRWLEKYKIPRVLSSLAAIVLGLVIIAGIGFFFYSQMTSFAEDAGEFATRLEELLGRAEIFLLGWFPVEGEINLERIGTMVFSYVRENTSSLTSGLSGAASVLTAAFLVPVYVFLILLFRGMLKNFMMKAFGRGEKQREEKVSVILEKVKTLVQKYITGLLMVISLLAVLYSTMLLAIGVDHAIFFGVFAAMLNVIPFIGPLMGSVLPILYSLITMESLVYPLIILGGFYVVQLLEGNFLTPVIVGSQVSMNALATLLLIFIGAQIWGLAGMILFIPLGAILKIICDEVKSLQPYGYLLGRDAGETGGKKNPIAQRIGKLSRKMTSGKTKQSDPEEEQDIG